MPPTGAVDEIGIEQHQQNESSPLLETTVTPAKLSWEALLQQHVVSLCLILIVLVGIGVPLQTTPLNMVVEEIICRNIFSDILAGDDPRCKTTAVQSYLAMLRGWGATFDCIPGIILAIPFGLLADRYGRRIVLFLSMSGVIMGAIWYETVCWFPKVFPIWMIWFASAFLLVGGGEAVVTAMLFTIVSDTTPDAQRATCFFRLSASMLVGEMIGNPLAASLMDYNPWLPIFTGLACLLAATSLLYIIPETLGQRVLKPIHDVSDSSSETFVGTPDESSSSMGPGNRIESSGSKSQITSHFSGIYTAFAFLWESDRHILLLIFTFVVTTLGRYVLELLMQYTTKRFNMSWSQAAYIITLRSITSLTLLLVILPFASTLLLRRFSSTGKDLWLARTSSMLLFLGALTIAFAIHPVILCIGLVIMSLGGGFAPLVRSLLTSLVEPHHVGTLYNMIAVTEMVGFLFAGPLLSLSFRKGLELGGMWIGLPFLMAGCLFLTAAIVVFIIRLPAASFA